MCFVINKWREFTPTKQYLVVVSGLTSITKLYQYSQRFRFIAEKKDKWKTPVEFMNDGGGDCEDWARWYVDVLVRVIGIDRARFVIHSGKNKERWDNKTMCHAITILPYRGKLALFSNNEFKTGYGSLIETGYYTFPDGLKLMEVRDCQGKILQRKYKLFGTF